VPVRIYTPLGDGPKPLVVFTFGGGFVTGSIEIADGAARQLAAGSGRDRRQRRLPARAGAPFPAGLEDAYAVLEWAAASATDLGADRSFLAVAGDSSGGNFAAAMTLMARERGGPVIAHQLLVYPVLDSDFGASEATATRLTATS